MANLLPSIHTITHMHATTLHFLTTTAYREYTAFYLCIISITLYYISRPRPHFAQRDTRVTATPPHIRSPAPAAGGPKYIVSYTYTDCLNKAGIYTTQMSAADDDGK